ncbi:MAG: hypothetical protein ACP5G1_01800, partial [Nanopusillaceae archaeon]
MYTYEFDLNEIEKKEIEKFLKEKNIKYDFSQNKCTIYIENFYDVYKFDKFIKSLKIGFDIKDARKIIENDWDLLEIDLKMLFEKKINHVVRVIGRIVGEEGKTLREIEKITGAIIKVKEKSVYIIG